MDGKLFAIELRDGSTEFVRGEDMDIDENRVLIILKNEADETFVAYNSSAWTKVEYNG